MARPTLRMIDGLRERADDAELEAQCIRREGRVHVAYLRLVAQQLPLWNLEQSQRMIRRLADSYERKLTDEDTAA